ncbi:MAG: gliding motility-associated C-terminal domain-containing protein [Opitutaceae bacterium]|nr:gliding motility-associated C-terminal domain-containing protein [Cytophagales bacterium]
MKYLQLYLPYQRLIFRRLLVIGFSIFTINSFAQLAQKKQWDGQFQIRMTASVGLQPVFINAVEAVNNRLLAESIITESITQRSGTLQDMNNKFKNGSTNAFELHDVPKSALMCTMANTAGCLDGYTTSAGSCSAGTLKYTPDQESKYVAMTYPDYDTDQSTFSSSMGELEIPKCAEIENAYLYWSGTFKRGSADPAITLVPGILNTYNPATGGVANTEVFNVLKGGGGYNQVKFKVPGGTYVNVNAGGTPYDDGERFVCVAEVTALLKSAASGSGQFWVGNLRSYPIQGNGGSSSGWTLIVVYKSPLNPPTLISLWDGLLDIGAGANFDLSGFQAPLSGQFDSYVGIGALDAEDVVNELKGSAGNSIKFNGGNGDILINQMTEQDPVRLYNSNGYPAKCGGSANKDGCNKPLYDANWCSSYDGALSSQITSYFDYNMKNGNQITRLPNIKNTLGYDQHHIKLKDGSVKNGAITAKLTVQPPYNGGASIFMAYISVVQFQPKLVLKKAADQDQTTTGVKRTYTLKLINQGNQDSFGGDILFDTLDPVTKYVANSVKSKNFINGNPLPGSILNPALAGTPTGQELRFTIPIIKRNDSLEITFDVDILTITDPIAKDLYDNKCKRTILNTAWIQYKKNLLNEKLKAKSNAVECEGGSEVKITITGLGNTPRALTTVDASNYSSERIVKHVRRQIFLQGQAIASDTAAYVIYDVNGNVVSANDIFPTSSGNAVYQGRRNLNSTSCQDIISITFKICNIPTFNVVQPPAQCEGTYDLLNAVSNLNPGTAVLNFYSDTNAAPIQPKVSSSGVYYVQATNGSCFSKYLKGKITVTINSNPTIAVTQPNAQCKGTVDLTAYVVKAPASSILAFYTDLAATSDEVTNLVAISGTYYVKANSNGCINNPIPSITVVIDTTPNLIITTPSAICASSGISVDLTAPAVTNNSSGFSPPFSYFNDAAGTSVLNGPGSVSPASTTTYYIKAINGTCSTIKPVTVTVNTLPTASISGGSVFCSEDASKKITIDLTGNGPFSIDYTDPSGTSNNLTSNSLKAFISLAANISGDFTLVKVTDKNLCENNVFANNKTTVTRYTKLLVSNTSAVCDYSTKNAKISFDVTGGKPAYTFTPTETSFNAPNFAAVIPANGSTYFDYKVSDVTGCHLNTNVAAYSNTIDCSCPVKASISNKPGSPSAICNDGLSKTKIMVSASGSVLGAAANYAFTITTPGGTLNQSQGTLTSAGNYEFEVGEAGNYLLQTVSDQNCTGATSGSAKVSFLNPTVSISGIFEFCSDDTGSILTANDNNTGTDPVTGTKSTYSWSTSAGNISGKTLAKTKLVDGETVTVTMTPGYSCLGNPIQASQTLKIYAKPTTTILASAPEICPGDVAVLTAVGGSAAIPSTFAWFKNGIKQSETSNTFQARDNGSYKVRITNVLPTCTSEAIQSIQVQNITIDAGEDRSIFKGEAAPLIATTNGNHSIEWSPANTLSDKNSLLTFARPEETTLYTITAISNIGCKGSDFVTVKVFIPLDVPNVFSPNGDGLNDKWVIKGIEKYPNSKVKVFNRWGSGIFQDNDGYVNPWNGTHNGTELPTATYYYVIDLKGSPDGSDHSISGYVLVVK